MPNAKLTISSETECPYLQQEQGIPLKLSERDIKRGRAIFRFSFALPTQKGTLERSRLSELP